MFGVDELGMLLNDLPVFEGSAQRPDPAARNRVVLVDLRLDVVLGPKPVSTAQPRRLPFRLSQFAARLGTSASAGARQAYSRDRASGGA